MRKKIQLVLLGVILVFCIFGLLFFGLYPKLKTEFLQLRETANGIFSPTGIIEITDANFSSSYDELYTNKEKYFGREIRISGYVVRDESLDIHTFLLGRDLLWCCDDDVYYIAFLVLGTEVMQPSDGQNIQIFGVLESSMYTKPENSEKIIVPGIRVQKMEILENLERQVFPL